ncbi:hypothetical protein G7047_04935 [Diaphorobacter sp. HDW4A]|uniref:hypothetical protein n=1 Tax=Diaphorobacter sp. HDW4A TaxID=2714924 RepID=UPI00140776B0|nr:hypothetical protein [Diaphorobacter sp. HDW4A]QIL79323.1 hypothetical protein G7047_04935 [Diaphorobacter sp. HDW4A]
MSAMEFLFELTPIEYWRCLLNVVCGKGHGLKVVVYSRDGVDCVEILGGRLPGKWRTSMKRAFAYWEKPRSGWVPWSDASIVWHTSDDGNGPRYSVPSQDVLVGLLGDYTRASTGATK